MAFFGALARFGMFLCVIAMIVFAISGAWVNVGLAFVAGCVCTGIATSTGHY